MNKKTLLSSVVFRKSCYLCKNFLDDINFLTNNTMKKNYSKPEIQVVTINHSVQLLSGSTYSKSFNRCSSNVDLGLGGGSAGEGRSRGCDDDWDDEDW